MTTSTFHLAPPDPRPLDDETLHRELATVLKSLHDFAHRTSAPAGTDVIEWVRIVHQESINRAVRLRHEPSEEAAR